MGFFVLLLREDAPARSQEGFLLTDSLKGPTVYHPGEDVVAEAAVSVVSAARKQRDGRLHLACFLYLLPGPNPTGMVTPTIRVGLSNLS